MSASNAGSLPYTLTDGTAEVVLTTLIERFTFSLGEARPYWNMNFLTYPSAHRDDPRPALPLRVDLVKAFKP